jgi:uncharacterized protein (TIGR02453 family)
MTHLISDIMEEFLYLEEYLSTLPAISNPLLMTFRGYPKESLKFFKKLKRNNKREWFLAHKAEYEAMVVAPSKEFMNELNRSKISKKYGLKCVEKNPLFRLNRDLRFSANKDPYKTHNGMLLSPNGTRKENGVLYFHLEAGNCFMAMGFWQPDPKLLAMMRVWVMENQKDVKKLLSKLKSKGLKLEMGDSLKRNPKGFEHIQDPEIADVLKLKHWIVERPLSDLQIEKKEITQKMEIFCSDAFPLLDSLRPLYERYLRENMNLSKEVPEYD